MKIFQKAFLVIGVIVVLLSFGMVHEARADSIYTLTASPSTLTQGETITVTYTATGTTSSSTWIGMYAVGAPDSPCDNPPYTSSCIGGWQWATAQNGTLVFTTTSPATSTPPGVYEFRYFSGGGYTKLATSNTVTITAPYSQSSYVSYSQSSYVPATLTATPFANPPGGSESVSWSNVASPTILNWIGLYTVTATDAAYINWLYTSSCAQSAGTIPKASGTCSFTMPMTPGAYEFRLFADSAYTLLAKSGTTTVTSPYSQSSYYAQTSYYAQPSYYSQSSYTPTSTPIIMVGGRVKVTSKLNVRKTPSLKSKLLGIQPAGALGTVIGGPVSADGYIWWNINFDSGKDGWSVQNYLIPIATAFVPGAFSGVTSQSPFVSTNTSQLVTIGAELDSIGRMLADNSHSLSIFTLASIHSTLEGIANTLSHMK